MTIEGAVAMSPTKGAKGKGKAMKKSKGKGKAMKKGKGGRKPALQVVGEGGEPAPKKAPVLSIRKRVLENIGNTPLEQALKEYQQKKADAEKAVEMAVKKEADAAKEAERLKQAAEKASADVETILAKNKESRSQGSSTRLQLLDLEKELAVLKKAESAVQMELQMLKEEAEGEEKRKELRAAKDAAQKAIAEAKEAAAKETAALKEAVQREKEATAKAKAEELEARKQAKDMQELAKEKAKEFKRQELEEKKRAKQELAAALGKIGGESNPKRVKIVAGEDVD